MDRNLKDLKTTLGKEVLADNRYRYDGNSRRVEKRQPRGLTSYAYDSMNRLAKVEYPSHTEELYYDRAGNRTRRVSGGGEELYRYDSRNRLTEHTRGGVTREYKYEPALAGESNGTADDSWDPPEGRILNHYDYDAWGNLTACEETVSNRFRFNGQQYDPITQHYGIT